MIFRPSKTAWIVAGLLTLSFVPVVAGGVRFHEVTSGAVLTEDNARFLRDPFPVLVHIVAVTLYAILGAFQFVPSLRSRKSSWHRVAGRVLAPAGLVVALGGLWMTATYPRPPGDGHLVTFFRVVFGLGMTVSLALALLAVRKRDFVLHGACAWAPAGSSISGSRNGASAVAGAHVPGRHSGYLPARRTDVAAKSSGSARRLARCANRMRTTAGASNKRSTSPRAWASHAVVACKS